MFLSRRAQVLVTEWLIKHKDFFTLSGSNQIGKIWKAIFATVHFRRSELIWTPHESYGSGEPTDNYWIVFENFYNELFCLSSIWCSQQRIRIIFIWWEFHVLTRKNNNYLHIKCVSLGLLIYWFNTKLTFPGDKSHFLYKSVLIHFLGIFKDSRHTRQLFQIMNNPTLTRRKFNRIIVGSSFRKKYAPRCRIS